MSERHRNRAARIDHGKVLQRGDVTCLDGRSRAPPRTSRSSLRPRRAKLLNGSATINVPPRITQSSHDSRCRPRRGRRSRRSATSASSAGVTAVTSTSRAELTEQLDHALVPFPLVDAGSKASPFGLAGAPAISATISSPAISRIHGPARRADDCRAAPVGETAVIGALRPSTSSRQAPGIARSRSPPSAGRRTTRARRAPKRPRTPVAAVGACSRSSTRYSPAVRPGTSRNTSRSISSVDERPVPTPQCRPSSSLRLRAVRPRRAN